MKRVQLILRRIIKIVATRRQDLRLKCTKFDFGWGSAPDRTGGAYSAAPDPLAEFKEPTSKGREGKGGKGIFNKCLRHSIIYKTINVPNQHDVSEVRTKFLVISIITTGTSVCPVSKLWKK